VHVALGVVRQTAHGRVRQVRHAEAKAHVVSVISYGASMATSPS
jgi:hypothetical protein